MTKGWTNRGTYTANGKTVLFRIEPDELEFYLFIFSSDLEALERDELHDNIENAMESACEWGASEEWREEDWKISFSNPPDGFRVASFYDESGMTISDYLKENSYYIGRVES